MLQKDSTTGAFIIVLVALLLSACAATGSLEESGPTQEPTMEATELQPTGTSKITLRGGEVNDLVSLVDTLRAAGVTVEPQEIITQDFFPVEGQIVSVNGESVQVFEFDNEMAAKDAAVTISPDGASVGTSMMMWVGTSHFYEQGKLIVLYVGDNAEVLDILKSVLGEQIAGG